MLRMISLVRYIASFSIRTKLILLIVTFLCVPFLIGGIIWYEKSTKAVQNNAIGYSEQLVSQINNHLDSYFADLERSTFPLITHPHVKKFMSLSLDDRYEYIGLNRKIQEELIPNFLLGRTDIYSFSIVSERGLSATYGEFTPKELLQINPDTEFTSKYSIEGIEYINNRFVLTVTRLFKDTLTYRTLGKIVIHLKLDKITSIAEKIQLGETGFIWIIDAKSDILYHPDREKWGQPSSEIDLADFRKHPNGSYIRKGEDGKDRLVIFSESSSNEWILVSEVPLQELMYTMNELRDITLFIGSILIVFVLMVLTVYSYRLTANLSNLQRLMNKAENGFLNIKAPEHRNDEIGRLNRSFNKMVTEIRRLIEVIHVSKLREKESQIRQREATMQALHSQINPHFLYNTLEVINSYAIVENILPISRMATSLAKIFRYSVGNPKQVVLLKNEIDHIHTYFDIQMERYPYLNIDFQVDEEDLLKVNSVQLMLQPIIENAILHGYENHKLRPQYIGIIGEIRDDIYYLHVVDHGGGMTEQNFKQYNYDFQAAASEAASDEYPFSKIGMWNVHYRILLHFGEGYGLHILNSDHTGTIVQIKLPLAAHANTHNKGEDFDV